MNSILLTSFLWIAHVTASYAMDMSGIYVSVSKVDAREAVSLRNREDKIMYVHVSVSDVQDTTVLNGNTSRGVALVVNDQVYIAVTSVRADGRGAIIPFSTISDWRYIEMDGKAFLMEARALSAFRLSGEIPNKGVLQKVIEEEKFGGDLHLYLSRTRVDPSASKP